MSVAGSKLSAFPWEMGWESQRTHLAWAEQLAANLPQKGQFASRCGEGSGPPHTGTPLKLVEMKRALLRAPIRGRVTARH